MQLIDRRKSKHKSTVNRQRFITRQRDQIKKAIAKQIGNRSVKDLEKGENISIPSRDMQEPIFHQGKGGVHDRVHPGNKEFTTGDRFKRPLSGQGKGQGNQASKDGKGDDDFIFQLTREEYLELLFEDLELPRLKKNQIKKIIEYRTVRAGHTSEGNPSQINIVRSLKGAFARRKASSGNLNKKLKLLEEEFKALQKAEKPDTNEEKHLLHEIEEINKRISRIPFIDTFDLRFNNYTKQPVPTTQAVMFCIMDVSGSMDQATKDIAKRFYLLLYLFLSKNYQNVQIVFIRHHTQAKEVDEEEFFYSRETGGTIVSSALELMTTIIKDRYPPSQWNIYAAQASDGDNWQDDTAYCQEILESSILPDVRYYAYIEITQREHQSLWRAYSNLVSLSNFSMKHIKTTSDIYPMFRELFQKQSEKGGEHG